ncbi:hypothetical protein [Gracilibacillus xinjiangensis]|uniref:Uncharacterized protein n=1 Tax=Gracilibacillus xinjiangensis TaxID=1193282 RepID=A0ABV8WTS5_9BACI
MGYIMPVDNYQYQQYHNRVTKEERDPFPIEKLYPVQFNMQYDREKLKEKAEDTTNNSEAETRMRKAAHYLTRKSTINDKVYAEVTGKGQQFAAQA